MVLVICGLWGEVGGCCKPGLFRINGDGKLLACKRPGGRTYPSEVNAISIIDGIAGMTTSKL